MKSELTVWARSGHFINVNLRSIIIATQLATRDIGSNKIAGAIVNMFSVNVHLAIAVIPAYCACKGGLRQLTKEAALTLVTSNVCEITVGPYTIDIEMMAGVNVNRGVRNY